MNKLSHAVLAFNTPALHNKVKGDQVKFLKNLSKKNYKIGPTIHQDYKWIPTDQLIPLESQRFTDLKWVEKRLKDRNGLDWKAFGTLDVVLDPRDQKYYVWNGCGRLAIAQTAGATSVPCVVTSGNKEEAAYYFAYNQDQGSRTLSKEAIFVNQVYCNMDDDALNKQRRLIQLDLYVKGDTDNPVPKPIPSTSIEVKYRTFNEGYEIAVKGLQDIPGGATAEQQALNLMKDAKDMIVNAWNIKSGAILSQDLFWGVLYFLKTYPTAKTGLQGYLTQMGATKETKDIVWKPKGLSGNSGVSVQLAYGLLLDWKTNSKLYAPYESLIDENILRKELGIKK